jgi:hypothetical protein
MAYVSRDGGGAITGIFTVPQAGAQEWLDDGDASLLAFEARSPYVPPTPRQWLERLSSATQSAIATGAAGNASILLWLLKAAGNPSIDVTLQDTRDGVAALEGAGLITSAEAATLLAP